MRLVVTLTTLPGRGPLLTRALNSLQRQTLSPAAIYLYVPRELFQGRSLPVAPTGVLMRTVPDLGPATKLLPVLAEERAPDTAIVSVDDDVEYPPGLLERLANATQLWGDRAIGFTGFSVSDDPARGSVSHMNEDVPAAGILQDVHVLEGYRGVIYRRRFFRDSVFQHLRALPAFRRCDDVLLSGYLAARGVPRSVIWYGDGNSGSSGYWTLLGDSIGLHVEEDFVEQNWAGLKYWRHHSPAVFPHVPTGLSKKRLLLRLSRAGSCGQSAAAEAGLGGSRQAIVLNVDPSRECPAVPATAYNEIMVEFPSAGTPFDTGRWFEKCRDMLAPDGIMMVRADYDDGVESDAAIREQHSGQSRRVVAKLGRLDTQVVRIPRIPKGWRGAWVRHGEQWLGTFIGATG